ncbi:MAG: alpha/beta hydrolase [Ferruginibacter sp.]
MKQRLHSAKRNSAQLLLVLWIVAAQAWNKMGVDDVMAINDFKRTGTVLTTHTEKINGHNLHYVSTGSDTLPLLVFIHGSPARWDEFKDYLKDRNLLHQYQMIAIDRPGFGDSNDGDAEHMNKQVEIISPLLKKLKSNRPMFLVGQSLGGPIVVELAYYNPGLIDGLVLLAGAVDPKEEKSERWRYFLAYSPLRCLVPACLRSSNDELIYFKKDILEIPRMLRQIRCRVFILHGTHDSRVPYGNALYAKEALVNAKSVEMITLRGADHFIPSSNYVDIKKVLLRLAK